MWQAFYLPTPVTMTTFAPTQAVTWIISRTMG